MAAKLAPYEGPKYIPPSPRFEQLALAAEVDKGCSPVNTGPQGPGEGDQK